MVLINRAEREAEHRTTARRLIEPDAAVVPLDIALADRKAGAGVLGAGMQAREYLEYALALVGGLADAIVDDRNDPGASPVRSRRTLR